MKKSAGILLIWLFVLLPFWVTGTKPQTQVNVNEVLELLELSISDENNRQVEIRFFLRADDLSGTLIINRYKGEGYAIDDGPFEPIDIDLSTVQRDPVEDYVYHHIDLVPAGIEPPFLYYLAYQPSGSEPGAGGSYLQSLIHRSIYLQEDSHFNACTREITIEWTQYRIQTHNQFAENDPESRGEPVPFAFYHIYIDDEYEESIDFEGELALQSYVHELLTPGTFNFRAQAAEFDDPDNPGRFSFSNIITELIIFPELEMLDMNDLSVAGNQGVTASAIVRGDIGDFEFALERSPDANDWEEVVRETPGQDGELNFTDLDVTLDVGPWYYRVVAYLVDDGGEACDEEFMVSEVMSTIFLELEDMQMDESRWDIILGITHPVQPISAEYYIEYQIAGNPVFEIASGPFFFTGNRSEQISLDHPLPFSEDVTFRVNMSDGESFSNLLVLSIEPEVNIPNAFRPNSNVDENRYFQPRFIGFTPSTYTLSVYDRHGLLIFSTNELETAWDGRLHGDGSGTAGSALPDGAYMYHVRFTLPSGEPAERKGVVYLVR